MFKAIISEIKHEKFFIGAMTLVLASKYIFKISTDSTIILLALLLVYFLISQQIQIIIELLEKEKQ